MKVSLQKLIHFPVRYVAWEVCDGMMSRSLITKKMPPWKEKVTFITYQETRNSKKQESLLIQPWDEEV